MGWDNNLTALFLEVCALPMRCLIASSSRDKTESDFSESRQVRLAVAAMAAEEILELSNGRITAKIAAWGATITSLIVPDARGPFLILFPPSPSLLPLSSD